MRLYQYAMLGLVAGVVFAYSPLQETAQLPKEIEGRGPIVGPYSFLETNSTKGIITVMETHVLSFQWRCKIWTCYDSNIVTVINTWE